ncbi:MULTISPECIES: hypothetical protein [unclassified Treponema]|uniref:hypothetical protein n=1 Tax=unclassified Treponema TaxID=2638727 RepID=UPI0020A320BD|nr:MULTISPECIES: hypothetical protein [unclassified Treponema]UTC68255.1 hypothetical protein E4O06_06375 [Treponema sp. OMZ 789]UTC70975.1 hypothetical protein E4O01_06520 [Treponema sp. OMZ 790]UTC73715.1 hypothetical protein E4O02_06715 [Treponema sp. OMZ 791]
MAANKKLIVFIFGLCPIIPASSNFAYGIVLAVILWVVFFLGLLGSYVAKLMDINRFEYIFVSVFMITGTALVNSLLEGILPIVHGPIRVYTYILTFSYIIFLGLKQYYEDSESLDIPIWYSALILVLSALREFFAFGSISFPVSSGFLSLHLPYFSAHPAFRFLGTTAGAFILLGLIIWIYFSVTKESPNINLRERGEE